MGLLRNLSGTRKPDQSHLGFCSWLTVFDHDGLFVIILVLPGRYFLSFRWNYECKLHGSTQVVSWDHHLMDCFCCDDLFPKGLERMMLMKSSEPLGALTCESWIRARLGSTQVAYLAPRQNFLFHQDRLS